ncbi:HK97-gp10 family putative phage morphogenesis protein [Staphylococcus agnetis]|uniref:HK97-gp10 family putative phage morphogenesis protein n=1 Tax=Staphylococcus agnetis TaxID=985762 RepID=UPI000722CA90|nr:HK97-gp10 family putative phage morphogenesis protein [Staphylococcus agnetis]ALN76066.1 hypothetical protein EP23_01180 [Staphylococcus agnetis]NJI12027.1 hypothetical protein [Staphylococcus agnetis]
MTKRRYDSDKDISDKINKLVFKSDKKAKQAVNKAAKLYQGNLIVNTPVHAREFKRSHAKDVTKISNFLRDETYPAKEVGYDKGKKRKDSGWYIHFPDVGTKPSNRSVGQPPQHFLRRTHEMSKGPILAIYTQAVSEILDVK